jgi:hypothetical protein
MSDSVLLSKTKDISIKNVPAVVNIKPIIRKCLREGRDYEFCMSLYMTDNVVSCQIQLDNLVECHTK